MSERDLDDAIDNTLRITGSAPNRKLGVSTLVALDADLAAHTEATDNPHDTTAAQVGAVALGQLGAASGVATLDGSGKLAAAQRPTLVASDVSDSTAVGRSMLTAIDQEAQRDMVLVPGERIYYAPSWPPMGAGSSFTVTSSRFYWTYIGFRRKGTVINYVNFTIAVNGSGAQVAEVLVFSTPLRPVDFSQTATALASSAVLEDITTGAANRQVRNASPLGLVLAADTPVYLGVRFAMGTAQPSIGSIGGSNYQHLGGVYGRASGVADLTTLTTFSLAGIAAAAQPVLWGSED